MKIMNDEMRCLKTLLIQVRSNIFSKDKRSALSNNEITFNLLSAMKDKILIYSFLFAFVSQVKSLKQAEKYNQTYDLVDCIHVVPDIVEDTQRDWKIYWNMKYINNRNDFSLVQYKELILSLDM